MLMIKRILIVVIPNFVRKTADSSYVWLYDYNLGNWLNNMRRNRQWNELSFCIAELQYWLYFVHNNHIKMGDDTN